MALTTCKKCGGQVSDKAQYCVHCGEPIQPSKKYCPSCGAEVSITAKFCSTCGKNLVQHNNTESADRRQQPAVKTASNPERVRRANVNRNNAPKWPIVVLSIAVVTVIAFIGYSIFVPGYNSEQSVPSVPILEPAKETEPVTLTSDEKTESNSSPSEDEIIDFSTGLFTMDINQLALWLDFRLGMAESGLSAEVTRSNVQEVGASPFIIAVGEENADYVSNKRTGIVYGIDSDGHRADGIDKHDIKKLQAVIYTDDPVYSLAIPMSIIAACDKTLINLLNDEVKNEALSAYLNVIVGNKDSYEFKNNGICYVLSRNMLGNYDFEVFADYGK